MYMGRETRPLINVRKSSSISFVCGSSAVKPRTCFTITLNVYCNRSRKKTTESTRDTCMYVHTSISNYNYKLARGTYLSSFMGKGDLGFLLPRIKNEGCSHVNMIQEIKVGFESGNE